MTAFKSRLIFATTIYFLLMLSSASAQVWYDLRARFQQYVPFDTQFAVVTMNINEDKFLWPRPSSSTTLPTWTGPQTYLFTRGAPGLHAEVDLMNSMVEAQAHFSQTWGGPGVFHIYMYTTLAPCLVCAGSINARSAALGFTADVAFTDQWDRITDSDAYDAMMLLASGTTIVHRICDTSCKTFQQSLLDCLKTKPVVCAYCGADKDFREVTFVNSWTASLRDRSPAAWAAKMPQLVGNVPEAPALIEAVMACETLAQRLPFGPPVRVSTGFGPVVFHYGPPGPNWTAVTGQPN